MIALARPDVRLHRSWADAVLDFGSDQIHGSGSWEVPEDVRGSTSLEACRLTVEELLRRGDPMVPVPDDRVRSDYYWITHEESGTDAEEVVGFIAVRHSLNAFLLQSGGYIGYAVRPTRRRQGYAGRALTMGLDRLVELGVERALLTVDADNVASGRTIEAAGGVYENSFGRLRRYWIDLA